MYVGEIDAAVGGGLIGAIFGFAVIFALIMFFATKSKKEGILDFYSNWKIEITLLNMKFSHKNV